MIDWIKTKEMFGYGVECTTITPGKKNICQPKVICICDKCGKERTIRIHSKRKVVDGQMKWECAKCVASRDEVKKKLSESTSKNWQNSDGFRKAQVELHVKQKNMDEETRVRLSVKTLSEMTEERRAKMSAFYKEKYSDPDYKEKRRAESIKRWQDQNFREKCLKFLKSEENRKRVAEFTAKFRGPSSIQLILHSILDDFNVPYKSEYCIGPYTFDCFLPDYNILIECQGDYWHSLSCNKSRDSAKATYISRYYPYLKLKCIWEHEFKCKNKVVSLIKLWCDVDVIKPAPDYSIVEIKDVAHDATKLFIDKYGCSGTVGDRQIRYGAFIGDELIAVCILCKTGKSAELRRLVVHPKYDNGLRMWMMNAVIAAIKNTQLESILMTVDIDDDICIKTGWQYDHDEEPQCWYVSSDNFVMLVDTLRDKAQKAGLTEQEFIMQCNYSKIIGKTRRHYIYRLR